MIPTHSSLISIRRLPVRALLAVSLLTFGFSYQTALAEGAQTVTFNSVSDDMTLGASLEGQFPQGLIDWGAGSWYLSGPWQELNGNSISFNGDAIDSATFSFVSPHELLGLEAYNGGDDSATVTLSCPGQADKSFLLAANEIRTLDTGWAAACSNVTISTSNGWHTNFDRLVIR